MRLHSRTTKTAFPRSLFLSVAVSRAMRQHSTFLMYVILIYIWQFCVFFIFLRAADVPDVRTKRTLSLNVSLWPMRWTFEHGDRNKFYIRCRECAKKCKAKKYDRFRS